jgi:hypothetical protein
MHADVSRDDKALVYFCDPLHDSLYESESFGKEQLARLSELYVNNKGWNNQVNKGAQKRNEWISKYLKRNVQISGWILELTKRVQM